MEKTAPEMAPTAAPRMNPLSVSWPIKAPVIAPSKVPTAATGFSILFSVKNGKKKKKNRIVIASCFEFTQATRTEMHQASFKPSKHFSFVTNSFLFHLQHEPDSAKLSCIKITNVPYQSSRRWFTSEIHTKRTCTRNTSSQNYREQTK